MTQPTVNSFHGFDRIVRKLKTWVHFDLSWLLLLRTLKWPPPANIPRTNDHVSLGWTESYQLSWDLLHREYPDIAPRTAANWFLVLAADRLVKSGLLVTTCDHSKSGLPPTSSSPKHTYRNLRSCRNLGNIGYVGTRLGVFSSLQGWQYSQTIEGTLWQTRVPPHIENQSQNDAKGQRISASQMDPFIASLHRFFHSFRQVDICTFLASAGSLSGWRSSLACLSQLQQLRPQPCQIFRSGECRLPLIHPCFHKYVFTVFRSVLMVVCCPSVCIYIYSRYTVYAHQ